MLASAVLRSPRSRKAAFIAGFLASALAVLPFSPARAKDLVVKFDQSTLLRMPRPVADVIIGNPLIVEVTAQSNDMLVVTGKTFGITNIIALDASRNIIQDQRVLVIRDEARMVSVTKGGRRESYNCAPNCNPSFVPGDEANFFELVGKSFERKNKMSEGAAEGQSAGQ
jgi:hypothetical protein